MLINDYTIFLDLNEYLQNITIISQGSTTVELSDDARSQLNLTYNTVYDVSIVATRAPCPLSRITSSIRLYYGECDQYNLNNDTSQCHDMTIV